MEVGDLVQHRIDGSYGTVIELKGKPASMVRVYWHAHNFIVLHKPRQVVIIDDV